MIKNFKIFESNNNDDVWAVISIPTDTSNYYNMSLFRNEESAINYFIDFVNGIASDDAFYDNDNDEVEPKDLIFTEVEAERYVRENEYNVFYNKHTVKDDFELPENLKIGRDTKKYNL